LTEGRSGMCGISAVVTFKKAPTGTLKRAIRVMHSAWAHRGPDGEGFLIIDSSYSPRRLRHIDATDMQSWSDVRAAIAFRRWKIQGVSEDAAQPMSSPDQQVWIVFNGEIYDMAFSQTMQQLSWVRPKRMSNFVENFLRGLHHNSSAIWRLYTAWRWMETTQFRRPEIP
jgi:glutamine phosphoribosylpyrophosphate amidotransferase